MCEAKTGRAWIELNMDNLRHNCELIRGLLPDNCRLMAALKANAYGHGAVAIARELNAMDVNAFCVASLYEGIELRRNGIKGEILILGYTHPDEFYLLKKHHLSQTVLDAEYARALNSYGHKLHVHIGIDTGMHRLGERCENIDSIIEMFRCKNLVIYGMFTHLCASDTRKTPFQEYTNGQILLFDSVVNAIKERGIKCPKLHMQSSYGLFNYPELNYDYARVGIALYGMLSTQEDTDKRNADLRPVLSVKARVSTVKNLAAKEFAGYGMAFEALKDMKIAVLSIGYADGVPRNLSCGKGYVLLSGKRAPIIGRICMDQMTVDVNDIPDVKANDVAVIIGQSENEVITVGDIASQAGTISNEILSRLGGRLGRVCRN